MNGANKSNLHTKSDWKNNRKRQKVTGKTTTKWEKVTGKITEKVKK